MILELQFDPWRGGFEFVLDGRSVLLVAGESRGGPRLAEPEQVQPGDYPFGPSGLHSGPLAVTYDRERSMLEIRGSETLVRMSLESAPEVIRLVFQDFM